MEREIKPSLFSRAVHLYELNRQVEEKKDITAGERFMSFFFNTITGAGDAVAIDTVLQQSHIDLWNAWFPVLLPILFTYICHSQMQKQRADETELRGLYQERNHLLEKLYPKIIVSKPPVFTLFAEPAQQIDFPTAS